MLKKTSRVLCCLLCLSVNTHAEQSSKTELDNLIADIETVKEEHDIPAVALIIVSPDKTIWSGTLGLSDRISGQPVTPETMFRIGSITKMFTGLAMLILQEDGLIELDAKVKDIMPEFPFSNQWQDSHPVRVAHFLEHTSGVNDLSREEFNLEYPMDLYEAIMWQADSRKTIWPPGMHKAYSNAGPGFAAYLLEHTSGMTYEEYVDKKIFTPLAMDSASFYPDERTLQHLATGYDRDGHKVIPYWHTFYRAFGAINVEPGEMGNFVQMLLNRGIFQGKQLVKEELIERLETPKTTLAAKDGLEYGYGLGNYTYFRKGHLFHGHGGDGDGYLARLGYNREKNLGYFMVINVFDHKPLSRIRHLIEDFIIGNKTKTELPLFKLTGNELKIFVGPYENAARRFYRPNDSKSRRLTKVTLDNGKLYIERNNRKLELKPVTKNHFRYAGETLATSAFVHDDAGDLYFQDEEGNYRRLMGH